MLTRQSVQHFGASTCGVQRTFSSSLAILCAMVVEMHCHCKHISIYQGNLKPNKVKKLVLLWFVWTPQKGLFKEYISNIAVWLIWWLPSQTFKVHLPCASAKKGPAGAFVKKKRYSSLLRRAITCLCQLFDDIKGKRDVGSTWKEKKTVILSSGKSYLSSPHRFYSDRHIQVAGSFWSLKM